MSTELLPTLEFQTPLETALANAETFAARLAPLKAQAQAIDVMGCEGYEKIGAILSEVRSIRKNEIIPLWAPFLGVVDRVRDFIKRVRQAAENDCEEIDAICRAKMKAYEAEEAKATAKEQKKYPDAVVQPNIPSVQGYRRSTIYRATVEDRRKFLNAFIRARGQEAVFLGQFLVIDEAALSAYYRKEKENAQKVPGVRYSCE